MADFVIGLTPLQHTPKGDAVTTLMHTTRAAGGALKRSAHKHISGYLDGGAVGGGGVVVVVGGGGGHGGGCGVVGG